MLLALLCLDIEIPAVKLHHFFIAKNGQNHGHHKQHQFLSPVVETVAFATFSFKDAQTR